MATPYVGEIRLFAGTYAPVGWLLCDGQVLSIAAYEVLFTLLGTTYGGDGQQTFALPDMRGRVPLHQGNRQGASYPLGAAGGTEQVTLTPAELPVHTHDFLASGNPANSPNPGQNVLAQTATTTPYYNGTPAVPLAPASVSSTGGGSAHDNLQPFCCINYIIATDGIYPSPN